MLSRVGGLGSFFLVEGGVINTCAGLLGVEVTMGDLNRSCCESAMGAWESF